MPQAMNLTEAVRESGVPGTRRGRSRKVMLGVAVVLVGLIVRCLQLHWGLPSINRFNWESDEGVIITNALVVGGGRWWPGNFSNAHLYMYVLTAVYGLAYVIGRLAGAFTSAVDFAVSYWRDPTLFYLLARGVSLVAGVVTVGLTSRMARRLYGDAAGGVAGVLLMVLPLHVAMSQQAQMDALAAMWATWSVTCLLGGPLTGARACGAGFLSGLAASTKYNGAASLFCLVVAHVVDRRRDWRGWRVHAPLVVGLLSFIAGFVLGTPAAVVHPNEFLQSLPVLHALRTGAQETPGYLLNVWSLIRDTGVGPGYVVLVMLGIGAALAYRTRADLVLGVALLLNFAIIAKPGYRFNPEYLLPTLPFAMILAGRAFARLWGMARMWRLALGGVFGLTVASALGVDLLAGLATRDTTYLASRRWIESRIPAGTAIAMSDILVPQLTFTPASLARRRAWGARPTLQGVLSPSQYHEVQGSRLAKLRDEVLTTGVAYDIHYLVLPQYAPTAPHLFPLGPSGLREQLQVEVVVSRVWGNPAATPEGSMAADFYQALQREWRCVATFAPGLTRSGVSLWVYASPEFADRLHLPEVCRSSLINEENSRGLRHQASAPVAGG